MHARAVIAEERLGHEGGGLAVAAGDVADDVLGEHDLIGALHQRLGNQVDLALAAGGDFVEMGGRRDPAIRHPLGHLRAQVDQAVGGRAREIPQARRPACSPGSAIRRGPGSRFLRPNPRK